MASPTTPAMRALAWEAFRKAVQDRTLALFPFDKPFFVGLDHAKPGADRSVFHWRKRLTPRPDMAQMLDDIERNYPRRIVTPELVTIRVSHRDQFSEIHHGH